ncbi:Lipopolysaccharide kinase (Kdo/WaaP) family protein [Stigmatella aurantiaca]|uniref:Lipopolysaccharide kinase (Kdo/WaaP) family protein n=1 Tax=Stigmatella aurantiaca TaxID=41 RepID=A0A1H7HDE0_STIAU|nr:DUF4032 domain-containing protein [Stigmatella aurantiaca]SEK48329.1 Lipopolysaccharide kinase (Kdo/WaaP) family protein [Stigmatella aurantiaca]
MPPTGLTSIQIRQGHPDFLDLPWHLPLAEWEGHSSRLVQVPRGLSRHEVLFVSYGRAIYALKELPPRLGQREYEALRGLEERELPSVRAVGLVRARTSEEVGGEESSVLITLFLEGSLPYRTLFMNQGLERYRERLLDAMASLLVRLHLGGFYWGDCSLSNTLFRRDAGELQAYAVDAETSEIHEKLSDGQRQQDLLIMEENVAGGLADLAAVVQLPRALDVYETGTHIRKRYERLWEEINKEIPVAKNESYRIHERIRALNDLGFSVGEVDLVAQPGVSDHLRMRTIITDRNYHRHQLHNLTGIVAEERQATLLLNELQELRATLTRELNRSIPLSTAAFRWLEERFHPTIQQLQPVVGTTEVSEVYCQVLEHKWFLSEREKKDVGLQRAIVDYMELRKRQKDLTMNMLLLGGPASPSLPRAEPAPAQAPIRAGDGRQEPPGGGA